MKYAKRYMAKIGSAGILLAALAATACMDHGDDIPLIELGAVENSFTVNATAGHVDIQVYSNPPGRRNTPSLSTTPATTRTNSARRRSPSPTSTAGRRPNS